MIARLVVLLVLVGCGGGTQAPVAKPKVDLLAAVPASFSAVSWFGRDDAPIFAYLKQLQGDAPACIGELVAQSEGYIQAQRADGSPSVLLFRGAYDRDALEACLVQLGDLMGKQAKPKRDGRITELVTATATLVLGFVDGGVVIDRRREVVDEVLTGKTHATDNAALMALVARTDRSQPVWMAGTLDYTSRLLGVPSRGFFLATEMKPKQPHPIIVTVVFATPADAQRAAAKVAAVATDPRFSPALQQQLAKLAPVVAGADVRLDAVPVFEKPELMAEIGRALADATR
jgi:hypothetical protein